LRHEFARKGIRGASARVGCNMRSALHHLCQ
jgi:hypothetical protein